MRCSQIVLVGCLLAVVYVIALTSAKCHTCGLNGIACASENTFHICSHGHADTSQFFTCSEGKVCVADGNSRCESNAVADCSKERNLCGVCDGSKLFTCLTPTTFVQCNRTSLLRSISGSCPNGLTCDSSNPEICVVGGAECS